MIVAHKIKLNPNAKQEKYFIQACNAARVVWNWALAEWQRQYKAGGKPSATKLDKQFNAIKHSQYSWVCQVSKSVAQGAIRDLGTAFKNFFKNPAHFGYPKFKKKGKCKESFYLQPDQFKLSEKNVRIPKMDQFTGCKALQWVDMYQSLRFVGKILGARISRTAGMWYISITVEMPDNEKLHPKAGTAIGVDLGVKKLAYVSTGEIIENINALRQSHQKLIGLQKKLSRQEKGSNKWQKTKRRLGRLHLHIANQRQDHIHKMTNYLTKNYEFIAVENLNVSGMLRNHCLARTISDASFAEIVRQIEYKARATGGTVQKVGRFFPSSKTCSKCGVVRGTLSLSERTYDCPNPECGLTIDRDLNAALNILKEGLRLSEIQ
jgi:putative transposase